MSLSPRMRKRLLQLGLVLSGIIAAGIIAGRMAVDVRPVTQEHQATRTPVVQEEISLYFSTPDASGLLEEKRSVPRAGDDYTALDQIVTQLARGPEDPGLSPVIPGQTRLLGVSRLDAKTLELDFNRELIDYHPGGSASELLTVHALTNSIAAYMPDFERFVFKVEGQALESLKGHVDLSRAVDLNRNWVRTEADTGDMILTEE
ncbi:MAG: GerMN domain-containing protein [Thermodesulfobacteriota bacterium]